MSGPPLDKDRLSAALSAEGVMLEADAYFTAERLDWTAIHSLKYGDPPDTRELDVLAVKQFRLEMVDDTIPHHFLVLIECKYSVNWWVFADLSRIPPPNSYYAFLPGGEGVATQLVDFVMESIRVEHFIDEEEPARVASIGEFTFGYEKAKRELFYAASRQVLSATAIDPLQVEPFSKQMKYLALYLPVVMTNEELILATIEEGSESFELEQRDWVVAGNQDDIVHVVTPSGLERLLRFVDRLIEGIQSRGAQELILKLFAS